MRLSCCMHVSALAPVRALLSWHAPLQLHISLRPTSACPCVQASNVIPFVCNPTPQFYWPYIESVADKLGLALGAPAAAPCGAECVEPDPFKWWDEFFAL